MTTLYVRGGATGNRIDNWAFSLYEKPKNLVNYGILWHTHNLDCITTINYNCCVDCIF